MLFFVKVMNSIQFDHSGAYRHDEVFHEVPMGEAPKWLQTSAKDIVAAHLAHQKSGKTLASESN